MKKNVKYSLLISALGLVGFAQAEENLWVYTKGSETRPKGTWEAKLSNISRISKNSGRYVFNDFRPEIEYGVTDNLTLGAEIMIFNHDYALRDEVDPMFSTQGGAGGSFSDTQFAGFELTAKYNLLSAYKDSIGLSVAASYENREVYRLDGAEIGQHSATFTILMDKNWFDNTLIAAFNVKTELERRKSPDVLEEEIAFDISAGISYRFKPRHFIGWEVRMQSDYLNPQEGGAFDPGLQRSSWDLDDFRLGTQHQYGIYMGPTYHYAQKDWWFTGGLLYQVKGGGSQHAYVDGGKNWDEHEKWHLGTTVGFNF